MAKNNSHQDRQPLHGDPGISKPHWHTFSTPSGAAYVRRQGLFWAFNRELSAHGPATTASSSYKAPPFGGLENVTIIREPDLKSPRLEPLKTGQIDHFSLLGLISAQIWWPDTLTITPKGSYLLALGVGGLDSADAHKSRLSVVRQYSIFAYGLSGNVGLINISLVQSLWYVRNW